MVSDLPEPGVTPGGLANLWRWAKQLNTAIETRYTASLNAVSGETSTRTAEVEGLQTDVDTRKQRIAYAEDTGNTAIALGTATFTALTPTFSVPPSTDDVTIRYGYVAQVTAGGAGSVTIAPCDVTAGTTPTALPTHASIAGTLVAGTFSSAPGESGEFNFGPSATWRTFRMYGFVGRDAASSLAASMRASGASPYLAKTWMEAVLG